MGKSIAVSQRASTITAGISTDAAPHSSRSLGHSHTPAHSNHVGGNHDPHFTDRSQNITSENTQEASGAAAQDPHPSLLASQPFPLTSLLCPDPSNYGSRVTQKGEGSIRPGNGTLCTEAGVAVKTMP